jgi:uncharacterized protein (TIGR00297 family)
LSLFTISIQFSAWQLIIDLFLAAIVSALAWRLGALDASGTIAATLLGGFTYGLGGLPAAILLIVFFASSSLLSRAFSRRKRSVAKNFAKGRRRDWAQVLANGGAGLLALAAGAAGFLSSPLAWAAFAGALACANADTWATELGVLNKTSPVLITNGKKVPAGTSGGISGLGNLAALGGALLIALVAAAFLGRWQIILLVTLAGFLASFVDSTMGATVQAIYWCPKCKKETERHPLHNCGTQTTWKRGWPWLDNDWVNFLASLSGALLTVGAFTILL